MVNSLLHKFKNLILAILNLIILIVFFNFKNFLLKFTHYFISKSLCITLELIEFIDI
jgi:uncharacterized membrane protein YczE